MESVRGIHNQIISIFRAMMDLTEMEKKERLREQILEKETEIKMVMEIKLQ